MPKIKTRSRLYIDCPYCYRTPKGRVGSLYEYENSEPNALFIKFERCPKCLRHTEARLGFIRDGKSRHIPKVSAHTRVKTSDKVHRARRSNKQK